MKKAMSILLAMVFVVCCVVPVAAHEEYEPYTVVVNVPDRGAVVTVKEAPFEIGELMRAAVSYCNIRKGHITGTYTQLVTGTHDDLDTNMSGQFDWIPSTRPDNIYNGHDHEGFLDIGNVQWSNGRWTCDEDRCKDGNNFMTHTYVSDATAQWCGFLRCINP